MSDAPELHGPGEGEDIGGRIRIKCTLADLVLTETAGTGETDPHVHRSHADAFWVLEGALRVWLGGEEHVLEPGDFALAPPGVVHHYRSEGARWLNIHAPGCGFANWLRSRGGDASFDQHPPPDDGGRPPEEAVLRRRGKGEPIEPRSLARGWIKAGADDGLGSVSLVEFELGPGATGLPPHRHAGLTDSFYVLDGVLTVLLGEEQHKAQTGGYAVIPPGNVHTVSNPGPEPVRYLNVTAPGGLERYLRELDANPGDLAAIAARHDFLPA